MERKYIIVNHQTNPECTSDYPATRTFAGTIEECAKDGWLHCLQVATGYIGDINDFSASVYTILPV